MAAIDPHYDDVALLLHFDGGDDGQTVIDNSPRAKEVGVSAYDIKITAAQSVFGAGCLAITGRGGYLTLDADDGYAFGVGDFAVEMWVKTTTAEARTVAAHGDNGSDAWWALSFDDGLLSWSDYWGGDGLLMGSTPINDGQWHHVAVTRAASTLRLFVDGVVDATFTPAPGDEYDHDYATPLDLSISERVGSGWADWYIDELRITKGVARYTEDFAVPTEAFYHQLPTGWMAAADSPLGDAGALAELIGAQAEGGSPLGHPRVRSMAFEVIRADSQAGSPLNAAHLLAALQLDAMVSVRSPLGHGAVTAHHDFTGLLGSAVTLFVMDLIMPAGVARVPISSWQATLQTGSSNYVQCVVPACTMWQEAINAATEFVIYRRAALPNGSAIEYEMARAPAGQLQFNRGPQRHTCTLSGYSEAFTADDDPPAIYDRALTGVRSSISSGSSYRVRCAVDWLLRPGHRAFVSGAPFIVKFINYYAPSEFDCYMDVGG